MNTIGLIHDVLKYQTSLDNIPLHDYFYSSSVRDNIEILFNGFVLNFYKKIEPLDGDDAIHIEQIITASPLSTDDLPIDWARGVLNDIKHHYFDWSLYKVIVHEPQLITSTIFF